LLVASLCFGGSALLFLLSQAWPYYSPANTNGYSLTFGLITTFQVVLFSGNLFGAQAANFSQLPNFTHLLQDNQLSKFSRSHLAIWGIPLLCYTLSLSLIDDLHPFSALPFLIGSFMSLLVFLVKRQEMTIPLNQLRMMLKFSFVSCTLLIGLTSINLYKDLKIAQKMQEFKEF